MKKQCLAIFLLCGLLIQAQNSNVYRYNAAVSAPLLGAGIGLNAGAFVLHKKKNRLTEEDLAKVDIQKVNAFDRFAVSNWDIHAGHCSDGLMYASIASPLLLLADKTGRKESGRIALMAGEVFILNTGLTSLTKEWAKRKRPFVYNPSIGNTPKFDKDATASFFSGHTSTSAAMCFFTAKVYTDLHPNSKMLPLVWSMAALTPAVTGILRVKAGKHFPTDVLVGYIVGAALGVAIPELHKIGAPAK